MTFYNTASREFQDATDSRRLADQLERTRKHTEFSETDIEIISNACFFFLATADAAGKPDCSVKGGDPGFVEIVGTDQLSFDDYDGNGMFRSLGNISQNAQVALLFVEFNGEKRKLRINGRASVSGEAAGAGTKGFRVNFKAEAIFPNCPRYLPEMAFVERSVFNPKPDYDPPEPFWKSKPDLREHLPRRK